MEQENSNLIVYETRKLNGEQILRRRPINKGTLVEAKFMRKDKKMEYLVYHLYIDNESKWSLRYYIVKETKQTDLSEDTVEYDDIREIFLGFVEDIDSLVKDLVEYYKVGRVMIRRNIWGRSNDAYSRVLYYNQVKRILRFENRARRFQSTDSMCPVKNINPKLIAKRVDFGDYCLESWGKKRKYTYITFSKETKSWLDKLCLQVKS